MKRVPGKIDGAVVVAVALALTGIGGSSGLIHLKNKYVYAGNQEGPFRLGNGPSSSFRVLPWLIQSRSVLMTQQPIRIDVWSDFA